LEIDIHQACKEKKMRQFVTTIFLVWAIIAGCVTDNNSSDSYLDNFGDLAMESKSDLNQASILGSWEKQTTDDFWTL